MAAPGTLSPEEADAREAAWEALAAVRRPAAWLRIAGAALFLLHIVLAALHLGILAMQPPPDAVTDFVPLAVRVAGLVVSTTQVGLGIIAMAVGDRLTRLRWRQGGVATGAAVLVLGLVGLISPLRLVGALPVLTIVGVAVQVVAAGLGVWVLVACSTTTVRDGFQAAEGRRDAVLTG